MAAKFTATYSDPYGGGQVGILEILTRNYYLI
jgi:hypothetical protein